MSPPSLAARCTVRCRQPSSFIWFQRCWEVGRAHKDPLSFGPDEIVWKEYIEERERGKKRFTCQQPTSHILLWSSKYKYKYKLSNGKIHVNLGGPHSSETELDPNIASVRASSGGGEGETGVELLSMALVTRVPGWRDKDPCPGDRGLLWLPFSYHTLVGVVALTSTGFPLKVPASISKSSNRFIYSVCVYMSTVTALRRQLSSAGL